MDQRDDRESASVLRHWHEQIPHDRMAHLVRDASRLLAKSLQRRLAEHGVSFGHWSFLRVLWAQEGLSQRELSEAAGVMEPTTFTALKAMEANDLIERRHLNGNRRKQHVFLTDKGKQLKDVLTPLAEDVNHVALARVSEADLNATRRTLLAMINDLAIDNQEIDPDSEPSVESRSETLDALLSDLVDANLILFNERVVDAFGHVSVRNPENPAHYFLARNMAPGLVTREDLIEFDLDGNPVDGDTRKVYLERYIHGEIYRARPDVMAVVHSHSPSVVPFSAVKTNPLRPVCHMSGFLGAEAPVFEIRDVAGDETNLLITSPQLGVALSDTLGENSVVLMRGHGSTVVAPTLKQAVYRAVYVEVNARLQADASQLGPVKFLTAGEARSAQQTNEGEVERPWQMWKKRARQARKQWLDNGV